MNINLNVDADTREGKTLIQSIKSYLQKRQEPSQAEKRYQKAQLEQSITEFVNVMGYGELINEVKRHHTSPDYTPDLHGSDLRGHLHWAMILALELEGKL